MIIINKLYLLFIYFYYISFNNASFKKENIKRTSLCNKGSIINICSETTTTENTLPTNFTF